MNILNLIVKLLGKVLEAGFLLADDYFLAFDFRMELMMKVRPIWLGGNWSPSQRLDLIDFYVRCIEHALDVMFAWRSDDLGPLFMSVLPLYFIKSCFCCHGL